MPEARGPFLNQQNNRSISKKKKGLYIQRKASNHFQSERNKDKGWHGYSHMSLTTVLLLIQDSTMKVEAKKIKKY